MTITVKLLGGLGNQLFQYACARNLADIHKTNLKLDVSGYDEEPNGRKYMMDYFNISASIAPPGELIPHHDIISEFIFKFHKPTNYFVEKHFHYDHAIKILRNGTYLDGYWQSEKYFKRIEPIIRREFTVITPPSIKNQKIIDKIKSCESISLHVRRGDYVTDPKTNTLYGTCPQEYYEKAIEQIKEKIKHPAYFIFSDDPMWTRSNMITGYPQTIVDINGVDNVHEDLRLMSYCKHHIIANSSLSWWGAWLSNHQKKIVIAPKKWFNNYHKDEQDIIPERWVKI
jgi:hypothetical protein